MELGFDCSRDANGVPHVVAADEAGMYRGQGYVHARDRGLQMLMMRILGQGRLSEFLDSSDDSLAIDVFFRRMNWEGNAASALDGLDERDEANIEAYAEGVNAWFDRRIPWELKLAGYKHQPWRAQDCVLLARMTGYLTLAQGHGEIERFLVELVQAGLDDARLESLFPAMLGGLDRDLIGKLGALDRFVPKALYTTAGAVRMMASNNWAVAGRKSKSGKPVFASDPHLETNRLPNVWSEISLSAGGRWWMGASMPGLPGVLIGRSACMAWGATYSFADAIDSWIEKTKGGAYWRAGDDSWSPFARRAETIRRKGKAPATVIFHENDLGTVEGDPEKQQHVVVTEWSGATAGAQTVAAIMSHFRADTVEAGMASLGAIELSFNWVLADADGNIGYQMSGLIPRRREGISGLVPLPGWDAANHWQGMLDVAELPREMNPKRGFIVTANENRNAYGKAPVNNVAMGAYRAERISAVLKAGKDFTAADFAKLQLDLVSLQAKAFMAILKPLLPDTAAGRALAKWDFRYDAASTGAWAFEAFYRALAREVFGERGFGGGVIDHLLAETGGFNEFYDAFDRNLLDPASPWYGDEGQEATWTRVAAAVLGDRTGKWGDRQRFTMAHMLFGGKLPRWTGFDRGPFVAEGGRATVRQGQLYKAAGRQTSFMPSYRFVADMAEAGALTALAGGPSDRRFSKWYVSDLQGWLDGRTKRLEP